MISQDALTMYIFQPILSSPIGMMKTKTTLTRSEWFGLESINVTGEWPYANAFSKNCENANPLARME